MLGLGLSAEVAAGVDSLVSRALARDVLVGRGLGLAGGECGALVVEALALAGRRLAERVGSVEAVAVPICRDGSDLLLPGGTSCRVARRRAEARYPRLVLLDGVFGERVGALFDQVAEFAQRPAHFGGHRSDGLGGTARRPAPDIAQALMEQRTLLVYDEYEDADGKTRRVLNPMETTAAQEKADALQERFGEWVWEDPARAKALVDEYNRGFNSIVLRDYTGAGEYLSLPGMAASFTPGGHQRGAVARMIAEPAAGLFHEVGAGKTAEMIIGAMEMRRMGLIAKPVVVVPNHMLEQFGREWLQIYPRGAHPRRLKPRSHRREAQAVRRARRRERVGRDRDDPGCVPEDPAARRDPKGVHPRTGR